MVSIIVSFLYGIVGAMVGTLMVIFFIGGAKLSDEIRFFYKRENKRGEIL